MFLTCCSPSTITSPRLIPMRNSIRRSGGIFSFSALSVVWISTAHWTAFTTLANSASTLSPAELTNLPRCCSMRESISLRCEDSAKRRLLVVPHEAAIAEDIDTEYGGELTFQYSPLSATHNRASPVDFQRARSFKLGHH